MKTLLWKIYRELVVLFGGYTQYWMYPNWERDHAIEMVKLEKELEERRQALNRGFEER